MSDLNTSFFSILRNAVKYFYSKRLYYKYSSNFASSDHRVLSILSELNDCGISIRENIFNNAEIKLIQSEIDRFKNLINKPDYINTIKYPNYAVTRYLKIDLYSQLIDDLFFKNKLILDVAKSYISEEVTCYQKMYEQKGASGYYSVADIHHFDDWKKRFKVFLYLNDVDESNCPFRYIPKSIYPSLKRTIKEIEYVALGKNGAYGYFLPHEVDELLKNSDLKEIICTGKAGTVIFVDTRGIHRGSQSLGGSRELLAAYFDN